MSHRIYTTQGFVIRSQPYGDGGKILFIFTAELGQIAAIAQGIRLLKSKLRYHAQDYVLANFSLVRGREFWRIVGAESVQFMKIQGSRKLSRAYTLQVRMFSVLSRLLQGEEKNHALFEVVNAAYEFLARQQQESTDSLVELAEPIIMLRILHHLGYVRMIPDITNFISDNSFAPEIFKNFLKPGIKAKAIKEINNALKESHL